MSDIFISHAVVDQRLAKLLVDFLKEAVGVPTTAIFCSSVKGHDIPLGEDFNEYIKQHIQKPKLVILLMTPAYLESLFCLMELGAAWAQGARSLALVVPPIEFQTVTKTLGLKQAWKVTDRKGLVDLRDLVRKAIPNLEKRSDHTWDEKRTQWNVDLKKVLPKLQQATKIDAKKHEEVVAELKEKSEETERLETALAKAQEENAELEKLKDKEDVKALKRRTSGSKALQSEFDELIAAVDEAKPKAANKVLRHIIADNFDRAGKIDWFNDRHDFEDAVRHGLISPEDDSVEWKRGKLQNFRNALQAAQTFLDSEDGEKLKQIVDSEVPMDPDDLEFWEYHLEI
jgi:TIR domain